MSVLILKNVGNEGPGTIEDYLIENRIDYKIVDCTVSGVQDAEGADTLIMMGGPMSVNETDKYPYLAEEMDLAAAFMRQGKKVLGICLGAQLMARALGARVYPGPQKEIGWYDVRLVGEGLKDFALMNMTPAVSAGGIKSLEVFHWHGETFDIPADAERLAESDLYPNQAFRFGKSSYAFQFHMEVTKEMIFEWLKHEPVDMERLNRETSLYYDEYALRARSFYRTFFEGSKDDRR